MVAIDRPTAAEETEQDADGDAENQGQRQGHQLCAVSWPPSASIAAWSLVVASAATSESAGSPVACTMMSGFMASTMIDPLCLPPLQRVSLENVKPHTVVVA